jgi:hypothetical protein
MAGNEVRQDRVGTRSLFGRIQQSPGTKQDSSNRKQMFHGLPPDLRFTIFYLLFAICCLQMTVVAFAQSESEW